jgi:hypothetical protein
MITSRRSLLFGAGATLLAAPAIVRVAANLMPVSTRAITKDRFWNGSVWWTGNPMTAEVTIWSSLRPADVMTYTVDDLVVRDGLVSITVGCDPKGDPWLVGPITVKG